MRIDRFILSLALFAFLNSSLLASGGTDAFNFLKIGPSARGASLGSGFVAVVDDSNAVFYNPAGLSRINTVQFSLMQMYYVADTSLEFASFAMPVNENISVGASVMYLNYGSIDKTTEDSFGIYSSTLGSYSPYDMAIALSGSIKLSDDLSAGLTAKYAAESIDTLSINGVMFDAGILTGTDNIGLGATIYDLGTVSLDKAPMYLTVAGSTKIKTLAEEDLTPVLGISYQFASSKVSAALGGEWKYENFLVLRGSYSFLTDADSLNLGFGLRQSFSGMTGELAYNFSLLGDLGVANRISVSLKFSDEDNYGKNKSKAKTSNTSTEKPKKTIKYYFKNNSKPSQGAR